MLVSVFLALFLPCVGMSAVFLVYLCLLWYAATYNDSNHRHQNHHSDFHSPVKPTKKMGLSPSDLDKLPKVAGKDLVLGSECAVCLDDIGSDEPARLIPGCNHGFHLHCADTWLSDHPICPVCRAKLQPELFDPPETNPC